MDEQMTGDRNADWWKEHFGVPTVAWVNTARGTGMPGLLLLHQFGRIVFEAFNTHPWLVGSAIMEREPHDIDVRLVLHQPQFRRFCWPGYGSDDLGTAWGAFNLAFAVLGRQITGLPIDFQIQCTAIAGAERFKLGHRMVLGGMFIQGMPTAIPPYPYQEDDAAMEVSHA